ncbi:MAG TPA: hypothetical protein VK668_14395 [Mucilaginibacter sp.]|nr:hypothetical protein [Mucilaginibacter sp.]
MTQLFKKATGIIALVLLLSLSSSAQTLNDILGSFNNYRQTALQEKVFVHTDKGAYLTGEIIWFKVYVVDGALNKPLSLSKVVYVDVLDEAQNPLVQAKIALHDGRGSGSLYIPVSANSGNFRLRAYTNWMKNFSPDYYFDKKITIVNTLRSPLATAKQNRPDYDIQFFPEGGNLVTGITSTVAFKAVGKDGKGISFKGAIIDQKNDTVVKFQPVKFGMGHFSFTPAANSTYKAIIRGDNNSSAVKDLPAVSAQGYVMQVANNSQGQLQVTVTNNNSGADGEVFLFAHTRQLVKVAKSTTFTSGVARFVIDKNALEDGISHITIFNSNREPLCERLYFKRPSKKLLIDAAADKPQYAGRKKVNISVSAKDQAGKPLNADMSMSVYRLDAFQTVEQGDIASYLWLSSDLRGSIESPEYYFKNTNAETDEALDNLMLTQGWRRFQWNEVLKNKPASFSFLPEYNGHIISGKLVNSATNVPTADVVAYLGVPGKKVQLFTAKSDTAGHLLFNTRDIYGPGEIVVQTNTQKDSIYRIDILSPFSEQYSKNLLPAYSLNADMQQSLETQSLATQVLNIYSGNKIKQFYEPAIDSAAFFGKPDKSYKLDDYTRFTTMEEVLREYIREVNVFHPQGKYHIKVIGEKGFLEGDPLVMLDGIPIFDINKVVALDPLKIRRLDVIKDRYFWGPADAEGILSYTTYKGDLGGVELDPHAVVVDYEGMQQQRVFYSPVYDTDSQAASRLPDFRNLLFWAPTVRTNAQGKNQVSFYTSDQQGQYIGVIQGITSNGEAGSQYFMFNVK